MDEVGQGLRSAAEAAAQVPGEVGAASMARHGASMDRAIEKVDALTA